jgi:hypothetical protein
MHYKVNKTIFVTFQKEGIHCYPEALTNPDLTDVSFLGHPHRHIFHFRVTIEVMHDNRDIEFIQFKRWLEGLYEKGPDGRATLSLNNASCEMLAEELIGKIHHRYQKRSVTVEVSEDGENGATVAYEMVLA